MTETFGVAMSPLKDARLGYCGQLLPNIKAKIVDIETQELQGPGKKGELVVHSPSVRND